LFLTWIKKRGHREAKEKKYDKVEEKGGGRETKTKKRNIKRIELK